MVLGKLNERRTIGSIMPSSPLLARAMTRFVQSEGNSQTILEVGAGSGAVTKALVQRMGPNSRADVVEMLPNFFSTLHRRFDSYPQINLVCGDILDFKPAYKYDIIISSLPFNSLHPEITESIFKQLVFLSKNGAILSFYEYKITQKIWRYILPQTERQQFFEARKLIENFVAKYGFATESVVLNLPPALVHFLKIDKDNDG